jgi:hypothetical protein
MMLGHVRAGIREGDNAIIVLWAAIQISGTSHKSIIQAYMNVDPDLMRVEKFVNIHTEWDHVVKAADIVRGIRCSHVRDGGQGAHCSLNILLSFHYFDISHRIANEPINERTYARSAGGKM